MGLTTWLTSGPTMGLACASAPGGPERDGFQRRPDLL